MRYEIQFHEHVQSNKIDQFLMRLHEIGINIEDDGERKYSLTTKRQGKAERLRFFLFESGYTKLFKVSINEDLR